MSIPPPPRWPRAQRFALSERGSVAAQSYLDRIVASRTVEGRAAFDAARADWAAEHGHRSEDALLLRELVGKILRLADLTELLDGYGPDAKEIKASLGRLVAAGLVEPVQQR